MIWNNCVVIPIEILKFQYDIVEITRRGRRIGFEKIIAKDNVSFAPNRLLIAAYLLLRAKLRSVVAVAHIITRRDQRILLLIGRKAGRSKTNQPNPNAYI